MLADRNIVVSGLSGTESFYDKFCKLRSTHYCMRVIIITSIYFGTYHVSPLMHFSHENWDIFIIVIIIIILK